MATINLKEIAREAGVSISTVSLVLNNKPGVNINTRNQVTQLLVDNGYAIKSGGGPKPRAITFIRYIGEGRLLEPNDEFFTKILEGAESHARSLGYAMMIATAYPQTLREVLAELTPDKTAGILILGSEMMPGDTRHLTGARVPLVAIDTLFEDDRTYAAVNTVNVENRASVFEAVRHLHELGHRSIGFLTSNERTGSLPDRARYFRRAMEYFRLKVTPEHIVRLDLFLETTYQQFSAYLRGAPSLPTAFFADKDTIAAGCIKAMYEFGLRVPRDISVVGFDNSYVCNFVVPPLTSMNIPRRQMGMKAVQRLDQLITGDDVVVKAKLAVPLLVRQSTAPPPPCPPRPQPPAETGAHRDEADS